MDTALSRTYYARRYGWWLLPVFVVLAVAVAWTARASILRGMAERWAISDPLERADGIVVLGGRTDVRASAAADLYKRGFASRILLAKTMRDPLETTVTRKLLLKLGVPAEAIVEFGDKLSSTYEEARAVLEWAKSSGAKSVIIPTELFPTRRVRWTFRHEVAPAGVRIIVHAIIKPPGYEVENWWKKESGLIDFRNEVIKFVYYRLRY
jgi:uncharacterized SAM-binding protein YcdF (DUF218 family)